MAVSGEEKSFFLQKRKTCDLTENTHSSIFLEVDELETPTISHFNRNLIRKDWFSCHESLWAKLLEHMQKKFEMNRTKIKGSCQFGRKVVTHDSKSDLTLTRNISLPQSFSAATRSYTLDTSGYCPQLSHYSKRSIAHNYLFQTCRCLLKLIKSRHLMSVLDWISRHLYLMVDLNLDDFDNC